MAVADEGGEPALPGLGGKLPGETGLADPGLAADHDQTAPAVTGLLEEGHKLLTLVVTAHQGGPVDPGGLDCRDRFTRWGNNLP